MTDATTTIPITETYPIKVFRPENILVGYAVWELLNAVVSPNLQRGGVWNQPQACDYDPAEPQAVTIEWEYSRHEKLPPEFFTYEYKVNIDPTQTPTKQLGTLEVVTIEEELDLLVVTHYPLELSRFLRLLPHLSKPDASSYLAILESSDCDEYDLTRLTAALHD